MMLGAFLVIVWWISLGIAYKRGLDRAPEWFESEEGHAAIKRIAEEKYTFLIERTPEDAGQTTVVSAAEREAAKTMLKAWLLQ